MTQADDVAREIVIRWLGEWRTTPEITSTQSEVLQQFIAAALTAANQRIAELERANRTRPEYDLVCDQCGKAHILDTVLPSHIWNQIAQPHELLCTLCIDERLQKAGLRCEAAEFYYGGAALGSRPYGEAEAAAASMRERCAVDNELLREVFNGRRDYDPGHVLTVAAKRLRSLPLTAAQPATDAEQPLPSAEDGAGARAALNTDAAGIRAMALEEARRAVLAAAFGSPSMWGGDRPTGWHMARPPTPKEAAHHDNGVHDAYRAIRVLAGHAPAGDWWQPIETAPKDGRAILLVSAGDTFDTPDGPIVRPPKVAIGHWNPKGDSWVDEFGGFEGETHHLEVTGFWASDGGWFQPNEVTHWMPLPSPPPAG
ncbi:MAG: DUF551 domain-containing protein [Bauldia sp.]|nr:DUF551 domain-containing protein [Bauldia sp.]